MKKNQFDASDIIAQQNLVNQPNASDAIASAFYRAGSNNTPGPQSAITNSILNGLGAGIESVENNARQEKLAPIYQMIADNNAKAAEIQAQMQQAETEQLSFKKFADLATPTVAAFASQVKEGDPRSQLTFSGLIDQLARNVPQYSKYTADHWNSAKGFGLLLNQETGEYLKITSDEILSAIAPRAQEIYGAKWFEKFEGLSAGLARDAAENYNFNQQKQMLDLESKRAALQNQYLQNQSITSSLNAPPPQEKGTINPVQFKRDLDIISNQLDAIGEEGEQSTVDRINNVITPGKIQQLTAKQTEIDTLGQLLRGKMFKAFGYRNETEFEQIPTISSSNSLAQNKAIINQYRNLYLQNPQEQMNPGQINEQINQDNWADDLK